MLGLAMQLISSKGLRTSRRPVLSFQSSVMQEPFKTPITVRTNGFGGWKGTNLSSIGVFFFKSNTLYIKLESKLIKMPMHSPEIKQSKMTLDTKRPILVQYQWTILIDSGLVPSFFGCLGLISRSRGIHVTTCWRRAPLSIYWLIDAEFYSSCSMIFHQEPGSKTPMKSKEHINQTMQEFDLQAFRSSRQFNPAFWHWGKDSSGPLPWPYGSGRTVFTWAAPRVAHGSSWIPVLTFGAWKTYGVTSQKSTSRSPTRSLDWDSFWEWGGQCVLLKLVGSSFTPHPIVI